MQNDEFPMNITIEPPEECRDFGKSPTVKISAYAPQDLFDLGRASSHLEAYHADFVIGTSADGQGKYLRLPLCPCSLTQ